MSVASQSLWAHLPIWARIIIVLVLLTALLAVQLISDAHAWPPLDDDGMIDTDAYD
jgi:uncharacterized protein (DUF983 family)